MERALVVFRNSDEVVVGTWRGGSDLPTNPDVGRSFLEVSIPEVEAIASKGLSFGDVPRWKVVGGALQEQADSRPRIRFTPAAVEANVGDPAPVVTVTRIDDSGATVPSNSTVKPMFLGHPVRLTLVNGSASLTIPTARPRRVLIGDGPNYRVEAPLSIDINSVGVIEL